MHVIVDDAQLRERPGNSLARIFGILGFAWSSVFGGEFLFVVVDGNRPEKSFSSFLRFGNLFACWKKVFLLVRGLSFRLEPRFVQLR